MDVPINRLSGRRLWRSIGIFARSEVRTAALGLVVALVALMLAINGLNVLNSFVGRDFITAIEQRSMPAFVWYAALYVLVFAASTAAAVFFRFTEERLGLLWREWLTGRLMATYLEFGTPYRLNDALVANGEIANADQRITDDVRALTTTTISFGLLLTNATITVLAFSGVLLSISPLLFFITLAYAAIGSGLTIAFGHSLIELNYVQLDKEANFRAELLRVRENAEAVVLGEYEPAVYRRLTQHLSSLIANLRRVIATNRDVGFFTTGYGYLNQIIPTIVVAPLFIRGQAEFGVITQSSMAFGHLIGAFSLIVTQFQSISSFAAVVARLGSLAEAIELSQQTALRSRGQCRHRATLVECPICTPEEIAPLPGPSLQFIQGSGEIRFEHLTLRSPHDDRLLLDDLSLSLAAGTRVLVTAQEEAPKIALLRVTAGIWDTGTGTIVRPPAGELMFVRERPYFPPATLRQLITPEGRTAADAELTAALAALQLEETIRRSGGLDSEQDWQSTLSLSEQQLLTLARVMIAAPTFVMLDRIDTALTAEQTERVLMQLTEKKITYIALTSVEAHGNAYDAVLRIAADGSWTWTTAQPEESAA